MVCSLFFFSACFSEDLRREKFVSLAQRRELKTCQIYNWRNTGVRSTDVLVLWRKPFSDREF